MCNWCEKADLGNYSASVDGNSATIYMAGGSYRYPNDEQFKFCPVCGEQLGEVKPLTLDELRERDGRPVWLVDNGKGRWAICTGYEWRQGHVTEWIGFIGFGVYAFEDYGKTWLAYDRQPKEAQHE